MRSSQRSSSLRAPKSPDLSTGQQPFPIRYKQRGSELWLDSVADLDEVDCWTPQQIKRQEAIYELYCGEVDLVEDIKLLQEVYFNPLTELKLLSEEDLESLFGRIQSLLPLHEDLVSRLEEVREENGSIHEIGEILLKWIPTLQPYITYCAKQLEIKELLFQVSKDKQVSDFFQRCLEAPCSRKLDLWSFLDSPRSKLVKYPLLVTNIHKYTPKDHPDRTVLEQTIKDLEILINDADKEAGISKCSFYKDQLAFVEDAEYKKAFDEAKILVCNGCLKNKSGSKVQVFLFDTIFICARTTTRNGSKVYVVNTKPVLVADMHVIDLGDGEVRLGGSFRTTLTKGTGARHAFRVCAKSSDNPKSVILQCNDRHDKKQWLNAFQSLLGTMATKTSSNDPLHTLKVIDSNHSTNNTLTINSASNQQRRSSGTNEISVLS